MEGVSSDHPSLTDEVEYVGFIRQSSAGALDISDEALKEGLTSLMRPRVNLWSKLPRKLCESVLSTEHSTIQVDKRLEFSNLSPPRRALVLSKCTYWFNSLKRNTRIILYNKYINQPNINRLKQLLITADGILFKILIANIFPVGPDPWKWDKILELQVSIISNLVTNHYKFALELKRYWSACKSILMDDNGDLSGLPKLSPRFCTIGKYMGVLSRHYITHNELWAQIVLLQTRFTGLVSDCIPQSIDEFRDMVRNSDNLDIPDWVDNEIDYVSSQIPNKVISDAFDRAKLVLTTSACTELPESEGGKGEVYHRLLKYGQYEPGEVTAGNWLFQLALDWYNNGPPDWVGQCGFRSTDLRLEHVSVVLETGLKARIVTAGSAVSCIILQPLSHILMEILSSIPELRCGLKSARNGWDLYSSLNMEDIHFRDLIGQCFAFSTDLERATDFAVRKIASHIIERFSRNIGVPEDYLQVCLDLWVGETTFKFPDGTLEHSNSRVVEMGKPITKAFLMLCHLLALGINRECCISRFNGDDAVIITNNLAVINCYRSRLKDLGFAESAKDTFISRYIVNYCEEWFLLPRNPMECFNILLKTSNIEACGYIDYPRIRLLLGVSRTRIASSYTPLGKVALLSRDLMWSPKWNPSYWVQGLCYAMQEANLIHEKDMAVAYIPVCLGGAGRAPMFGSSYDLTYYYSGPKRVWREKVFYILHFYGVYLYNRRVDKDEPIPEIRYLFRSNLKKVHLGNEGENIELMEVSCDYDDFHDENRSSIICSYPKHLQANVLSILRKEGLIVSDRDVMTALMVEHAHKYMLGEEDQSLVYTTSSRRDIWAVKPNGLMDINLYLSERIYDRSYEDSEEYFPRSIIDDLYNRDDFSITVRIPAKDPKFEVFEERLTDRQVKVLQLANWVFNNKDRFRMGLYQGMPTELLDDDPVILRVVQTLPESYVIIVTQDRKLCKQILEVKNRVLRLSPMLVCKRLIDPKAYSRRIIEDTGSIQAWQYSHHGKGKTVLEPPTRDTPIKYRSSVMMAPPDDQILGEFMMTGHQSIIKDLNALNNLLRSI